MGNESLMDTMAEMMSAEYRQVIDNMLLSNEFGNFKTFVNPLNYAEAHEVEVEFDD